MEKNGGCFHVATWDHSVIIRVEGNATRNNSLFFKDFIDKMLHENFRDFIIDLSMCKGMDSTFMGVLAGVGIFKEEEGLSPSITLINVNSYHQNLLDNLGISQILCIKKNQTRLPDLQMTTLKGEQQDARLRVRLIQQAHQCLISLNEKNAAKFGEFLKMLNQEMEQQGY